MFDNWREPHDETLRAKLMGTINQKVVVWALGKVGRKVATGECWDLAEYALKQAGAKTSSDLGPVDADSDYVWGDSIAIKDVIAGDILQFRDYEETTTTETEYAYADGTVETASRTSSSTRSHHTAVVNGSLDADGAVKVLEQNAPPHGKAVQNTKLYTRDVAPVETHPVERRTNPTTKKVETAAVTRTVTVTVTGQIWA